ncbi:hypothetical protein N9B82_04020 [Saprospiraceae bacterium]|nr:hypothetical protein [Saprospiraceae bacterium]
MKKYRIFFIGIGLLLFLFTAYFITNKILFDGVVPIVINESGIQAKYYSKTDIDQSAAVVLVGGGQWGDYWAQEFANKGFVGLSLAYTGKDGLPSLPEQINLEYFENALKWLVKKSSVDADKIIVMGASRNAELSLVIASVMPEYVHGVVVYAPSSVSWSNTVLAYNSDEIKPSWVYREQEIPYVPMPKLIGNDTDKIETLDYWNKGLNKAEVVEASIQVERINGPILLFSGEDDQVWPAAQMADLIEQRLSQYEFQHAFQNIKYQNSGHLISGHPEINPSTRTGTMQINGKGYQYLYGGTTEGDKIAKQDAKVKLMEFVEKM